MNNRQAVLQCQGRLSGEAEIYFKFGVYAFMAVKLPARRAGFPGKEIEDS